MSGLGEQPFLVRVVAHLSEALVLHKWCGEWVWSDLDKTKHSFCVRVALDAAVRLEPCLCDRVDQDTIDDVLRQGVIISAMDHGASWDCLNEGEIVGAIARAAKDFGAYESEDDDGVEGKPSETVTDATADATQVARDEERDAIADWIDLGHMPESQSAFYAGMMEQLSENIRAGLYRSRKP